MSICSHIQTIGLAGLAHVVPERVPITVHPRSSRRRIERHQDGLHVWLTAAPTDGKANAELLQFLSDHFALPRSAVRIVSGRASRRKMVELG